MLKVNICCCYALFEHSAGTALRILNCNTDRDHGMYCITGYVGPTAGLDRAAAKTKMPAPSQVFNLVRPSRSLVT
jgi:hypothetical protein